MWFIVKKRADVGEVGGETIATVASKIVWEFFGERPRGNLAANAE